MTPLTNHFLLRTSIRRSVLRMRSRSNRNEERSVNVTRSVVVVIAIWSISLLLALMPLLTDNLTTYRQVGHIFVVMISLSQHSLGLIW